MSAWDRLFRRAGPQADPASPAPAPPKDGGQVRRIALAGRDVDYRLFRARRRTIGMQVGLDGLKVRAPRWVSIREVEGALAERAAWIVRALDEWNARRRDVLPRAWVTGAPILYRGSELTLVLRPSRTKSVAPDLVGLNVLHPAVDDERQVAGFVAHWLKEEALRLLAPQVAAFAARLPAPTPPVRLSNARSEWGSCSHRGEVRLNWRLVHLPPALAAYVVAHEVAHLAEMNHSPRFWAVVESLYPGHAAARRALHDWTALLEA